MSWLDVQGHLIPVERILDVTALPPAVEDYHSRSELLWQQTAAEVRVLVLDVPRDNVLSAIGHAAQYPGNIARPSLNRS